MRAVNLVQAKQWALLADLEKDMLHSSFSGLQGARIHQFVLFFRGGRGGWLASLRPP